MKVLYYQCFCGISGDMNLGAMIDIGVPEDYLRGELAKLHLDDEFDLLLKSEQKQGITGTRAEVKLKHQHSHEHGEEHHNHHHGEQPHHHDHAADHNHHHGDGNGDQPHHHDHAADHHHNHEHHHHSHRGLSVITGIIRESDLSEAVKERSVAIFSALAEAEAHIHGMSVEEVHFHEVGATDAIVDIVGAAICLDYLGVDKVYCSPVEVGGGFVECAHGRFPVPAPATTRLLRDIPLTFGTVDGESTTPTGAAILKISADEFTSRLPLTPHCIGYGIGHRDFSIPNVLRVVLGELSGEELDGYDRDRNEMIETDIDDMVPEDFGVLRTSLFEHGALDVVFIPVSMKNDRPGTRVTVLCRPEKTASVTEVIFTSSTTAGVRVHEVTKVMLPREIRKLETSLGVVEVKILSQPPFGEEGRYTWKVEYRDLFKIARKHHLSVPEARAKLRDELSGKL